MIKTLHFFQDKLVRDGCGKTGRVAMLMQDDIISGTGPDDLQKIGRPLIEKLGVPALALFEPSLPFYNSLIRKTVAGNSIVPTDTETRTFLHDIPFIRSRSKNNDELVPPLAKLLGKRKGVLVEDIGIIAVGPVTLEQAYINASSLFHAIFVKYLLDLLHDGVASDSDHDDFVSFKKSWLKPLTPLTPPLRSGSLKDSETICKEMIRAGKETVNARLVDSSFGNISCRCGDIIYISQTGASLDDLNGCIDPVSLDNSSTCGVTASSELLAHRMIYEQTGDGVILHGHPKFSIIMSMVCDQADCSGVECWSNCPKARSCADIPIVSGEIGAGGLAEKVSPAIKQAGRVIVYGHGVFTFGRDFNEAFKALLETETTCRKEYFSRNCSNC